MYRLRALFPLLGTRVGAFPSRFPRICAVAFARGLFRPLDLLRCIARVRGVVSRLPKPPRLLPQLIMCLVVRGRLVCDTDMGDLLYFADS